MFHAGFPTELSQHMLDTDADPGDEEFRCPPRASASPTENAVAAGGNIPYKKSWPRG
jgi:hypothetical protein